MDVDRYGAGGALILMPGSLLVALVGRGLRRARGDDAPNGSPPGT